MIQIKSLYCKFLLWWNVQTFDNCLALLYREGAPQYKSTGIRLGFGLFYFDLMAGWRVPEIGVFPISFGMRFFKRVDFGDFLTLFTIWVNTWNWNIYKLRSFDVKKNAA